MDGVELAVRVGVTGIVLGAAWTDLRDRRIPNALTLPAMGGLALLQALRGQGGNALAGAALAAGVFLLPVFLVGPERAGAGDLKLGVVLGLALGFPRVMEALLIAFGVTALGGGALWALGRLPPDRTLPMGPGLALGALWGLWGPG